MHNIIFSFFCVHANQNTNKTENKVFYNNFTGQQKFINFANTIIRPPPILLTHRGCERKNFVRLIEGDCHQHPTLHQNTGIKVIFLFGRVQAAHIEFFTFSIAKLQKATLNPDDGLYFNSMHSQGKQNYLTFFFSYYKIAEH